MTRTRYMHIPCTFTYAEQHVLRLKQTPGQKLNGDVINTHMSSCLVAGLLHDSLDYTLVALE